MWIGTSRGHAEPLAPDLHPQPVSLQISLLAGSGTNKQTKNPHSAAICFTLSGKISSKADKKIQKLLNPFKNKECRYIDVYWKGQEFKVHGSQERIWKSRWVKKRTERDRWSSQMYRLQEMRYFRNIHILSNKATEGRGWPQGFSRSEHSRGLMPRPRKLFILGYLKKGVPSLVLEVQHIEPPRRHCQHVACE